MDQSETYAFVLWVPFDVGVSGSLMPLVAAAAPHFDNESLVRGGGGHQLAQLPGDTRSTVTHVCYSLTENDLTVSACLC